MIAVLLAAGRGSRMGSLTANTPKPLLPLRGKPVLEHILLGFRQAGVHQAVIVTGYLGEQIENYFGRGDAIDMALTYRRQSAPTGTAAALLLVKDMIGDRPFALSWGDIIIEPSQYLDLINAFKAQPCDVLLGVNEVDDPWAGAAVYFDHAGLVAKLVEKPPRGSSTTKWNNAGVFCMRPTIFPYAERLIISERNELELPQAVSSMVKDACSVRVHRFRGYWSDLGTPDDLEAAQFRFPAAGGVGGTR